MRSGCLRESEGSVLVVTLWILFVVAMLGVQYSKMSRMESLLLIHGGERAKARYAALGGIEKAAALLKFWNGKSSPGEGEALWPLGGEIELPQEGDVKLYAEVEDEGDKLNINTAKPEEIAEALEDAGMDEDKALTIADSIADWRDKDNNRRPHGAEKADYEAAGKSYGPPNRLFESIFELPLVNGVDWESFWEEPGLYRIFTIYGSKKKKPEVLEELMKGKANASAEEEEGFKLDEGEVYRFTVRAEAAKIEAKVTAWFQYRGGKFYLLEKRIW